MQIYAPYPFVLEVILLPDPQLSNQAQTQDEREYRISMDKTVHSYVKTLFKKIYIFSFLLTREKSAEFEIFIQTYGHEQWSIIDHHGNRLNGHMINNPIAVQFTGAFIVEDDCPTGQGYSGNERAAMELEFEA